MAALRLRSPRTGAAADLAGHASALDGFRARDLDAVRGAGLRPPTGQAVVLVRAGIEVDLLVRCRRRGQRSTGDESDDDGGDDQPAHERILRRRGSSHYLIDKPPP